MSKLIDLMKIVTQQVSLAFDRETYPEFTEEQACKHIFDAIYLYIKPTHDENAEKEKIKQKINKIKKKG